MTKAFIKIILIFLILQPIFLFGQDNPFQENLATVKKPWTDKSFKNDSDEFQFAIVTDRTGGHRDGVFGKAIEKLNLLQPEFVMCVGDLIEGYTKDQTLIDKQWSEFNNILSDLQMRFFYLPGNHDISNDVMREQWLTRYGKNYYHFVYKDVLFLAFDSNDGDGVMFGEEQMNYFKQVIEENKEVKWTLLFMHHPIWRYKQFNRFGEIEDLLKDRPYTVFAGHTHRYLYENRNKRNYYMLSTTGGGNRLRGPKFGEMDHVVWMTMTKDGPKMINIALDGLIDGAISTEESRANASALFQAAQFDYNLLGKAPFEHNFEAGQLHLKLTNSATDTLFMEGRFYHNHHLDLDQNQLNYSIAPNETALIKVNVNAHTTIDTSNVDPLELDWVLKYRTDKLDLPFELTGTLSIPVDFAINHVGFTELDLFLENHEVEIQSGFDNLILKYTLDGTDPDFNASTYDGPIQLTATTEVKARLFSKDGTMQSQVMSQTYQKVKPIERVEVSGDQAGLNYQYFEDNFSVLPDFKALKAKKSGIAQDFNVEALSDRIDHYALLYEGFIEVPSDGIYQFYIRSDDGSKLIIQDELVVDNDGSHSARTLKGAIALQKGKHPIRIEYFEDFLGQQLRLEYEGPGIERQKVDFEMLTRK